MIKKLGIHIPFLPSDGEPVMPILPGKTLILFPGETITLQVGRQESLALIKENTGRNRLIGVTYSPSGGGDRVEEELCQIGTSARIISAVEGPGGSKIVTVEGIRRIALKSIQRKKPYLTAKIAFLDEKVAVTEQTAKISEEIISAVEQITEVAPPYSKELPYVMKLNLENPGRLADKIAATFHFPINSKQEVLETFNLEDRLEKVLKLLNDELERITISYEIRQTVKEKNLEDRRRNFLRQQLYEIKRQLGEDNLEDRVVQKLRYEVANNKLLPYTVKERANIEIERLAHLSTASAEYGATKLYLDWLLNIPWNVGTSEDYDLKEVEADINRHYYGSPRITRRILEKLAIRKLKKGVSEGSVLCLAGSPGTGKASLTRAIANALGKKFIRISAGGLIDLSDIKGTARTFLGAMPGIFIRTIKDAGVCDPVVFIEDIECFSEDSNSALPMAMLEAIDPKYNSAFLDNYIGVSIDLSRAIFVCGVRGMEDIPDSLNHRFEIIDLPGYIEKEKILIARKHIIPDQLKRHGLAKRDMSVTIGGLKKIIRNYTMEAGLLEFTHQIERLSRHVAREKVLHARRKWNFSERNLEDVLGTPQYIPEVPDKRPEIGVCIGLAWTGSGGELMIIEGLKMKGSGEVITTGSLGDVMKESIQAAHSYVRSKADILGIDHSDFNDFDIHIHFPSGAIPKDGPSAGSTVTLVIASVMSERPIRNDIAMTGEVTLRGKVMPVGGIKEKISAAYRAGIRTVLIPRENKKDLKDLPQDINQKTKFIFIESVDEVLEKGLLDFQPSSYTLEKIFQSEIDKVKKKSKSRNQQKIAAKSRRHRN